MRFSAVSIQYIAYYGNSGTGIGSTDSNLNKKGAVRQCVCATSVAMKAAEAHAAPSSLRRGPGHSTLEIEHAGARDEDARPGNLLLSKMLQCIGTLDHI